MSHALAPQTLEVITKKGNMARNLSQVEYAHHMLNEFNELNTQFADFQAVKLLFTAEESDSLNMAATKAVLDQEDEFPEPLAVAFTTAGFPLTAKRTVSRMPQLYGETKWEVAFVSPEEALNTLHGVGINLEGDAATFGQLNHGVSVEAEEVIGTTLTIRSGAGAGLQGVVATYNPNTNVALLNGSWNPTPDADSHVELSPVGVRGVGVMVDGGQVRIHAFEDGILPTAEQLAGTTLTIVSGPGKGLSGTIQSYEPDPAGEEPGMMTMGEDWQPVPDESSHFQLQRVTTYTMKEVGHTLEVFGQSDDPSLLIQYGIGLIDEMVSRQLSAIMHSPEFQSLEASWRGLHDLVMNTETGTMLKLRLLNATRDELQDDLDNAVEFDQSALFKMIYEAEYGLFGGTPYSTLVFDHEFTEAPRDVALIEKLSNVAAAAHAPLIAAAHPGLFDLESYADLDKPRDLAKIFESANYIKWRAYRDSEDSRYVTLTLPHTLMRLPYGQQTVPVRGFDFEETSEKHNDFLWGNSAWALGQRITTAYSLYGWTAAIRGYEGGGMVPGLPIFTYTTDDGEIASRIPTEVAITDRREKELSDLGFIALCYRKNTDQAAFFGGQTTNKAKVYMVDSATANAQLSAQLPYILATSRFAHYIKAIARDKVGSFMTAGNVSDLLNNWIADYILLDDNAAQEHKARYPLREARVDVTSDPARPGCYKAVAFLRPHFQLEELTVSIRLVAQLPPPAGG